MGLETIVSGIVGLGSAAMSAHATSSAAASNAAAQSNLNKKTMEFNKEEAAKARKWSANQAVLDRQFNASMQEDAQAFNAKQAAEAMKFSAEQADIGRQFNSQEALLAREWEERMSSSAHQREVQDLRSAGLNPILSATGGNGASSPVAPILSSPVASGSMAQSSASSHSTPSGSAASVSGLKAPVKESFLGNFMSSALSNLRASADLKRAEASDKEADAAAKNAETNARRQSVDERHIEQQIKTLQADERWKDFAAKSEAEKVKLVKEQIISEQLRQTNEKRLTDARVSEAGAIAYQAVKNADTEAAYKAVLGKMAQEHDANEKKRLGYEAQELKYKWETGQKALERDWIEKHPYWSHTLTTIDKVMSAVSPIKLGPLKD